MIERSSPGRRQHWICGGRLRSSRIAWVPVPPTSSLHFTGSWKLELGRNRGSNTREGQALGGAGRRGRDVTESLSRPFLSPPKLRAQWTNVHPGIAHAYVHIQRICPEIELVCSAIVSYKVKSGYRIYYRISLITNSIHKVFET